MGIFICEKCGKVDNTACSNNYWHASMNKYLQSEGREIDVSYKPEFVYFETHLCCSECCEGIVWKDSGEVMQRSYLDIETKHWTEFGKEFLLNTACMNAKEYFDKEH